MVLEMDELTIYNSFGHMITTYDIGPQQLEYRQGHHGSSDHVQVIHLPDEADEDSVAVICVGSPDYSGDDPIQDIEHNVIIGNPLFEEGRAIILSEKVGANNYNLEGILRKYTNEYVDIEIKKKGKDGKGPMIERTYRVNDWSQIVALKSKEKSKIIINGCVPENMYLQISYLFNNISWHAVYTVIVDDHTISYFKAAAHIDTNVETIFEPVKLNLVSGHVDRPYSRSSKSQAMYSDVSMARAGGDNVSSHDINAFADYHEYVVSDTTINKDTVIPLFVGRDIKSSKMYYHHLSDNQSRNTDNVKVGYNFVTDRHLPAGKAYVYRKNSCYGMGRFVGATDISIKDVDDEVDLIVGSTNKISIESNISRSVETIEIVHDRGQHSQGRADMEGREDMDGGDGGEDVADREGRGDMDGGEGGEDMDDREGRRDVADREGGQPSIRKREVETTTIDLTIHNRTDDMANIMLSYYLSDNEIVSIDPKPHKIVGGKAKWMIEPSAGFSGTATISIITHQQ